MTNKQEQLQKRGFIVNGIDLGTIFCGESMFTKISNASKVGLISFVQNSNYKLIDCQVYT